MKKYIFIIALVAFLNACTTSTLTDKSLNTFVATATQGDLEDQVQVKWIKTPYFKTFTIYRSESDTGLFTPIATRISGDMVADKNIVLGQEYIYKVQGFNDNGTPMHMTEPVSGYAGAKSGFYPPNNIRASSGESTKEIKIEWNRVEHATTYTIYRGTNKENLDPIGQTPYLHYVDKVTENARGVVPTYYYAVSSYHKDGYDSQKSTPVVGTLFGGDINLRSLEGEFTDKIRLTWNALPHVTTYTIFRSEKNGVMGTSNSTISASQLGNVKTIVFDDTTIDKQDIKVYYYTILFGNASGSQQQSSVVRGYRKSDTLLSKPQNLSVSQGQHAKVVSLSWDAVSGAASYDIARATSANGPWEIIGSSSTTSFNDTKLLQNSYTAFYRINAYDSTTGPGQFSDVKEGWAVRAPMNIEASYFYSDKIRLSWDAVPGARAYTVYYSENKDSTSYKQASRVEASSATGKVTFDHSDENQLNVGSAQNKTMYYKIDVATDIVFSDISPAIKGSIQKMSPPKELKILGNKTPTRSMTMVWKAIPNVQEYRIYRATLKHKDSDPGKLTSKDFVYVGKADNTLNPSYSIVFNTYPIRRHIFTVMAVNKVGEISAPATSELVWRLPVDVLDFAKDVDFTIIQAQLQIPGFGNNGSSATVHGRGSGNYVYAAGIVGSKNNWNDYNSFETLLKGSPSITIDPLNMSAKMNGPMDISGLYTGRITYNDLNAYDGGKVFAGSMTVEYNHPTKGKLTETWPYNVAGGNLLSVVLNGSEEKPPYPSFEEGGG